MIVRRPLYLNAAKPVRVRWQPPTLAVVAGSAAERLYPLRRIEHIVVTGAVEWETRAILACAERGIVILFTSADGNPLCRIVGPGPGRQTLGEIMPRLFERPDWQTRYRQWCWAMNLQTRRYVATRLGIRFDEARDLAGLAKVCARRLRGILDSRTLGRVLQWLRADLLALTTMCLQNEGLWREHSLALAEPIDLAHDITRILQPVLLEIRDKEVRALTSVTPPSRRDVALWSARHGGYMNFQVSRVVSHLQTWILENG